jgi:secreted PhoX family phosphatase
VFRDLSRSDRKDLEAALNLAQAQSAAEWSPSGTANPLSSCIDRRAFLRGGAALVGAVAISSSLRAMNFSPQHGSNNGSAACGRPTIGPYGAPVATIDEATGLRLLRVPPGFRYWSFGWTGDPMDDGVATPALHDGMAIIRDMGRWLVFVRNHEVGAGTPFGNRIYSPGAGGGTTNLVFDRKKGRFVSAKASLSGTIRNCSGTLTPWGTWITNEETSPATTSGPGGQFGHGYSWEIGVNGVKSTAPITGLGRFSHEAGAVDPRNGVIYQTEDGPSASTDTGSGFYRFLANKFGRPERGGKLQMLKVRGKPGFNLQPLGCDGQVFRTEWVTIDEPDPNVAGGEASVFQQGLNKGGASFRRLEGCWYGDGKIFFVSTDGGPATASGTGEGQVFVYDPRRETLRIIFVSEDPKVLENPDNIVVAPDGSIVICEDNSGGTGPVGNPFNTGERLIFLKKNGDIFDFAFNDIDFRSSALGSYTRPESGTTFNSDFRQNEWAGAVFSPDGKWLFACIQTPGITFAIKGPWEWLRRGDDDDDDD